MGEGVEKGGMGWVHYGYKMCHCAKLIANAILRHLPYPPPPPPPPLALCLLNNFTD